MENSHESEKTTYNAYTNRHEPVLSIGAPAYFLEDNRVHKGMVYAIERTVSAVSRQSGDALNDFYPRRSTIRVAEEVVYYIYLLDDKGRIINRDADARKKFKHNGGVFASKEDLLRSL